MTTTLQRSTASELYAMPDDGFRYELVRGELRRMSPSGSEHDAIVINISVLLGQYVKSKELGVCFGAETGFKIASDPDTVRAPGVAYIRRGRIPESGIPKRFWPGAPDLAVEVLSPGDTRREVAEQVEDWLGSGAQAVWVINPKRREATVHRSVTDAVRLSQNDELDGGEVVPGFRCKVSEIFV